MADFCNPLTDAELLNAKIQYPATEPKVEDGVLNTDYQKSSKEGTNLAGLATAEVRKSAALMKTSNDHKAHKGTNQLFGVAHAGKTHNNISFKFGTATKVRNLI